MKLNELQQKAIDLIVKGDSNIVGLFGEAGTGKTFVLRNLPSNINIAFTAPTNKAVNVLIDSGCYEPDCMTIYSFLGLVLNESTGVVTIDKKGKCKSDNYDVLAIDESSMLDDNITNRVKELAGKCRIVLIGDMAQLPPVKMNSSPAFKLVNETNSIVLTEQMRQADKLNPMRVLLSHMRESILSESNHRFDFGCFAKQITSSSNQKNGIIVIRDRGQFDYMAKNLIGKFKDNPSAWVTVVYRNSRVDEINEMCHAHIYPDSNTTFAIGEYVTFQRPYTDGSSKKILVTNGSSILINDIEQCSIHPKIGKTRYDIPCVIINKEFITPLDRNNFNLILNTLAEKLVNKTKEFTWKDFYKFRDGMADLRHSYCLTTHKAQGSTYENVLVDARDIQQMQANQVEINRCLYTAISRARYNVIILI